ncbi:MAG: DUF1330 domain-containing protein [Sphingomonadaceae bacterium]
MSGYVDPSPENWQAFKDLPRDTPLNMLNLLKFRELADYPEGHANHGKGKTGADAYGAYKEALLPIVEALGGGFVWSAPLECTVTGPPGEWDEAFVMGYPDAVAFFKMLKDPAYIANALPHRTAAVADSRLIRFRG